MLNVFRMFGQMSGKRLAVSSDGAVSLDAVLRSGVRDQADVSAMASLDDKKLCVLLWHYHDDDVSGPAAAVEAPDPPARRPAERPDREKFQGTWVAVSQEIAGESQPHPALAETQFVFAGDRVTYRTGRRTSSWMPRRSHSSAQWRSSESAPARRL